MWAIDYSHIEPWLDAQDDETVALVFAALELLEEKGPVLGRPLVDTIHGSRIKNLKELRPASTGRSEVRILFAFDPVRQAIMLVAGNKAEAKNAKRKWSGWYKLAIPQAEKLFETHIMNLEAQDVWPE
jgi:hypothetical protein